VATAQAAGTISAEHARVITAAAQRLPAHIEIEHGPAVEARLVAEAQRFDPATLARLARHLLDLLDPDGTRTADTEHHRHRHATLTCNHDGSGDLRAHLTPACLATLQTVLDPLAAPRPTDADGPDTRTPGQRLHDALDDLAARLLHSGALPPCGGTPATVLLTMTVDQLQTRTGLVTTAHGGTLSVTDALHLAGQAEIIPIVLDNNGILAYAHTRRTASPAQRLALTARDQGCCFPGCDTPPTWTQAHHIRPWAHGGTTDLNNLALICGYHHRHFEHRGWQITMHNGHPHWTPPPHIDPHQTPIRNTMHDTVLRE
jgi:hypothetical protein